MASSDPVASGRLRLRQLLLLTALGETGNLRQAAARIGIAQPAATRMLGELEATLGTKLFERSSRGMLVNTYGDTMIRHARRALNELSRAHDEIGALASGQAGRLRLGSVASVSPILLPRAAARLRRDHPGVHLSFLEGGHEMLVEALQRGEIDVLLARSIPPIGPLPIRYEVMIRERHVLVAGLRHPLARHAKLSLAQVVDEAWILPPVVFPFRRELDATMIAATGRRPVDVIDSVSILVNQTLLRESRLLGVMPYSFASQLAGQGLIATPRLDVALPDAPVALLTAATTPELPVVARFAAILRTVAAELERQGDHDPGHGQPQAAMAGPAKP